MTARRTTSQAPDSAARPDRALFYWVIEFASILVQSTRRPGYFHEMKAENPWSLIALSILGAYVAVSPSISLVPAFGLHNEKRMLQIAVLLAVGGILLVSSTARKRLLTNFTELPLHARWGLGAVFGLGMLSAVLAPAPFYAFLELSHFVLLFVAAGVVASAVRQAPQQTQRVLLGAVVVSVLLYAVYFAVRYGGALAFPALEIGRETVGGFANTRFFNQYQTWTLPLLGGAVLALPNRWNVGQGVVLFLAALWWTLIFASNVRGTVVAMCIAAIGVWLLFRKQAYHWLGVQAAALLAGGVLYYVLFTLAGDAAPQVVERLGNVGQSRRLETWAKCLDMAWAHPWLGLGPMHFSWPPYHFVKPAHPHSAFLQWLAEWGIPSTGIMSGMAVWGGWKWIQQERDTVKEKTNSAGAVGGALVAAMLAGGAHAMVSGLLVMPVSQVLFALLGGWAWGRYKHSGEVTTAEFSFRSQAMLCVVLVASIGIVGSSLRDLSTVEERRSAFLEAVERNQLSPRYWTQGYIGVRDSSVIERARRDQ